MNRVLASLHGGSLEITITVFLKRNDKKLQNQPDTKLKLERNTNIAQKLPNQKNKTVPKIGLLHQFIYKRFNIQG